MAYTTLVEVKRYLGVPTATTDDDTLLAALILVATGFLNSETHRVFEAAESTRLYSPEDVDGSDLVLDEDLVSVTTLTNGTLGVVAASSYVLVPLNNSPKYRIRLKATSGVYWDSTASEGAITVKGFWGYSTAAPADIQHAATRLTAFLYRQKDAQVFEASGTPETEMRLPGMIPLDISMVIKRYRKL